MTAERNDANNQPSSPDAQHSMHAAGKGGGPWRGITWLGLILMLAAGLRVARINYDGLTFDEQWHLELSTGRGSPHVRMPEDTLMMNAPAVTSLDGAPPWYAVWTNMDFVVHPPLYVTLLRLWREVFGQGDQAARSFSILCTLIAIAFLFLTARISNGLHPALWAAAIFAAAPTQIFMAQQVRGYDLLLALGLAAAYCVVRLERSENGSTKGAASALAVLVLAMMLTHYFAIGLCVALGVFSLIRLRGSKLKRAMIAYLIAGIVYGIVWGPFLWKQRQNVTDTADPWLIEHAGNHAWLTLQRLATAPWRLIVDVDQSPFALLAGAVLIAPMVLLIAFKRRDLLLWVLWIAGTLIFLTAMDFARGTASLRYIRYISPAGPAVFILIPAVLSELPKWIAHGVPLVLVVAALSCSKLAYTSEEPNWRDLGATIDKYAKRDETLLFYPGLSPSWFDEIFYLGAAHYSHSFPRPIARLSGPASADLLKQLPGKTAWLISGPLRSDGGPIAPEIEVQKVLPGTRVLSQHIVPNLAVCTQVDLSEAK